MSHRFWNICGGLLLSCVLWVGCDERPWVSGKADPKEENNYRQAEAYQRMNQYSRAVEYYQRALDVNPRNADAHLGLGIIHSDSAKLPEYGFAYYHLRRYVVLSGRTNDLIVNQLSLAEYQAIEPRFSADVLELYDLQKAMKRRELHGAPGVRQVARQLARWKKELGTLG